jgi:hypothetical protein
MAPPLYCSLQDVEGAAALVQAYRGGSMLSGKICQFAISMMGPITRRAQPRRSQQLIKANHVH